MWNQNQGQGRRNYDVSVNTTLYSSLVCAMLHDKLQIRLWNNNLTVRVSPAVTRSPEGYVEYASDSAAQINCVIQPEKADALLTMINESVIPAIKEGRPKAVSIILKTSSYNGAPQTAKLLTVGYDGTNTYFRVTWNLDESGLGNENSTITHVFQKTDAYEDYDIKTGNRIDHPIETDFNKFVHSLELTAKPNKSAAHFIKYDNQNNHKSAGNGSYAAPGMNPPTNGGNEWKSNTQSSYQSPSYAGSLTDLSEGLPFN